MFHVVKFSLKLQCFVLCGPWKLCENIQLSTKIECSPFSTALASGHRKWTTIRPKMEPKSDQDVVKSIPTKYNVFDIDSGVILVPNVTQNWSQNEPQIEPNGTPGRSGGRLGERWGPKVVPVSIWQPFSAQNGTKMSKNNPKLLYRNTPHEKSVIYCNQESPQE